MAIGDIPKIPSEQLPRFRELIEKVRDDEIAPEAIRDAVLSVMGTVRIDASGISMKGDFGSVDFYPDEFKAMTASLLELIDFLPVLKNREFLVKKGDDIQKIKLGLTIKKSPATPADLDNESYPMVEFEDHGDDTGDNKMLDFITAAFFQDIDGTLDMPEGGYKIHRLEEFAGWFGEGWGTFARLLNINVAALPLTSKGTLDRIGAAVPAFWDDVLKRCGV